LSGGWSIPRSTEAIRWLSNDALFVTIESGCIEGNEAVAVNITDFQTLAEMRNREARILLKEREFDGAYYIAGYAVECALKACYIKRKVIPLGLWPSKKLASELQIHDLKTLVKLADLEIDLNAAGTVATNWLIVKDWSEERRYEHGESEVTVKEFCEAIDHPTDGVLQWLRARW
jgi:HEPN domain-containing protein